MTSVLEGYRMLQVDLRKTRKIRLFGIFADRNGGEYRMLLNNKLTCSVNVVLYRQGKRVRESISCRDSGIKIEFEVMACSGVLLQPT